MIQRRVVISGRVQGVGFRQATLKQVQDMGSIVGSVQNRPGGQVEAIFQGPESEVLKILEWCQHGPSQASVTAINIFEEEVNPSLNGFKILAE